MSGSPIGKTSRASSSSAVFSLPVMKRTNTQSSTSSGKSLFLHQPKSSNFEFSDDIDCREWLAEIGLEQYANTFLTNLSSDGIIILRRRLTNIRQQDLSQMNITDFDDQKAIMAHIKLVLKHPFNSAVRKREVAISEPVVDLKKKQATMAQSESPMRQSNVPIIYADGKEHKDYKDYKDQDHTHVRRSRSNSQSEPHSTHRRSSKEHIRIGSVDFSAAIDDAKAAVENSDNLTSRDKDKDSKEPGSNIPHKRDSSIREKQKEKKQNARRRRSFDSQIWNSITSMRTKQSENAAAASNLREGIIPSAKSRDEQDNNNTSISNTNNSKLNRRRRHSFDPEGAANFGSFDARDKANAYGNMALEYDMMLSGLKELQSEFLNKFKSMIGCEKASIFFVNEMTRELVLFTDNGEHFRIPPGSGIAGVCAETGVGMNIPDAYADERFNRNLDIRTGFRTRNILCQPVRRSRGGGNIVAVIQMINKDNNGDFGADDEDVLAACASKVGDMLSERFAALQSCAERFLATATFVAGKSNVSPGKPVPQHTRSVQFESIVTEINT